MERRDSEEVNNTAHGLTGPFTSRPDTFTDLVSRLPARYHPDPTTPPDGSPSTDGIPSSSTTTSPSVMAPAQPSEYFEALIEASFGILAEGYRATGETDAQRLVLLQRRYQRRRDLAEYTRFPEGYEFEHELTDGERLVERHGVILLTPPDFVAVQNEDGIWTRRPREVEDGPAPYSLEWYFQYLVTNHLPLWFMRPEHMHIANNDAEATSLGLSNAASNESDVPVNYLDARYPEAPRYLVPQEQMYGVDLNKSEMLCLARRFPATVVNSAAQDYRVFVDPSGQIVVHYRDITSDSQAEKEPSTPAIWKEQDGQDLTASYLAAATFTSDSADGPPTITFSTPPRNRSDEIDAAVADGGLVDIDQIPYGRGRWTWLNPVIDAPLAQALNLANPVEVTIAVQNGRLNAGMPFWARPRVIYTPNRRFFNPTRQPTPHGYWRYFTTLGDGSSQALAWLNFGGQEGFEDTPQPTADQIWRLRRNYQRGIARGHFEHDPTESIDIVWVPTARGETPVPPALGENARESSDESSDEDTTDDLDKILNNQQQSGTQSEEDTDSEEEIDKDKVDVHTGLDHSPQNRGENDQTGQVGSRFYQTRMIRGKRYTVDRSRAHALNREPHKLWALNKNCAWEQYRHHDTLDWDDKASVEKLNKWREQIFTRGEWPKKRGDDRRYYPNDQKKFVFDLVADAGGERPNLRMADLTKNFNRQFNETREIPGVTALVERMKTQWKKDHGVWKEKPERGTKKSSKAQRKKSDPAQHEEDTREEGEEREDDADADGSADP